jgi:predicted house-cleaning noncanonical NTP pyrophosphatase (MazG superfamily)
VTEQIVFSPHFGGDVRPELWTAPAVGLKALGLLSLPIPWTPSFAVIPSLAVDNAFRNTDFSATHLGPLLQTPTGRLIVRSSATAEDLQARGWLESRVCDARPEDIRIAVEEVAGRAAKMLAESESHLGIVIQYYIPPILYGHLSNERRVTPIVGDWLCEVETATLGSGSKASRLRANRGTGTPSLLICGDEQGLPAVLRKVACWGLRQVRRSHCEWIWDGKHVWIVQRDEESYDTGPEPNTSSVPLRLTAKRPKLKRFVPATKASKAWKKAESLRVFTKAGLQTAQLFALEDEKCLRALADGQTPPHLRADLEQLMQSPIVIRTDLATTEDRLVLLSPRSDSLTTADAALQWLKMSAGDLIRKGAAPNSFCFLAHRYIPARAGAFGFSRPDHPKVRVDAIWGFPDGLLGFPHDSFEIDPAKKGSIRRHLRCKPFYLACDERGRWLPQKCFPPWDWKPSLSDNEIKEISRQTKRVSAYLKQPVEVMFFVGVDAKSGYPAILPWVHDVRGPERHHNVSDAYYSGKPFVVTNETDLARLREAIKQTRERSKVYVRLRPTPDLLRSKEFVNKVAAAANNLGISVQLEGSILSHIYYMLTREKVHVRCLDAFLPAKKQKFGKLVRDLIPVKIGSGGETAVTVTVPKAELAKLLKVKALEEAFELFWEDDTAKSFEEMADILEVIQSACTTYGRSFNELVKVAEKKREERGGFEKGVFLLETNDVPLLEADEPTLFGEAFGKGGTAMFRTASSVGLRKPRVRGKDIAIPLIPPEPESGIKQYVTPLPDGEHELLVRYTRKELQVSVRRVAPSAAPTNQLEFAF